MAKRATLRRKAAKDYCGRWGRLYYKATGSKYLINWGGDGALFRRLMSDFTGAQLSELIEFAFSDHPSTDFLKSQGYPVRLFASQINHYNAVLNNPAANVPEEDLDLKVPYWDDSRTSYIWAHIQRGDLGPLIKNITDDYYWALLMAKLERQMGFVPAKVETYFKQWKLDDDFKRESIKHES